MTKSELNERYFDWMYQLVCGKNRKGRPSYQKLLKCLHDTEFTYTIPMDDNRAIDGTDLRYRFAYENAYEYPMIATYLDDRPCTVLEMIIALAIRCEEHIMDDPDIGNRTGKWFWGMIDNLGLGTMDDAHFREDYVNQIVSNFLNRQYGQHGEGGLFTVQHTNKDLRSVEIWCQMCWHLNEIA